MTHRHASLPKSPFNTRAFLRRALLSVPAAASAALLFAGHSAKAASDAYATDATSGNFSTSFTLGTTTPTTGGTSSPASGDALYFGTETTGTVTPNNDLTGVSFAGITFNSGASAFTIGGNTFTLTGGITNNSTSLETFTTSSGALTQANSQTYTLGGGITITNGLTITGGNNTTLTANGAGSTLTLGGLNVNTSISRLGTIVNGSGNVNITGNITAGDTVDNLTYSGTGTLTIAGGFGLDSNGSSLNVSSGTISLTSAQQGAPVNVTGTGSFTETSAGSILNNGSPTATFTQNSTGTTTLAGSNTYSNTTTVSNGTFNLSGTGTLSGGTAITVNGGAFNESAGAVISAGSTFTTTGGTTTLSGANTYTGATNVNGGTLTLDFSGATTPATATNLIKSGNTVNLGGGTLALKGGGTGDTNAQTFGTTAFTAVTASKINLNSNGGTLNLVLGGLTRNAQSSVDITLPTAGTVSTTSTTFATNGVLTSAATNGVAFATVNGGAAFASNTTGTIGAITPATGSAYGAAANVSVGTADAPASGAGANTLTFGTAGMVTFTSTNAITTGGILVTPSATGVSTITGGTLTAGGGKDLTLFNYQPTSTGSLTVSSTIADNATASALSISGVGTTILTAANTFTGQTALLGGTLNLSNQFALQNSVLQINAGTSLVFDQSVSGNAFTIAGLNGAGNIALLNNATTPAPVALTLNVATGTTDTYTGVLSGTGATLTKTGAGTQYLNAASTYTGVTAINGGILYLGNAFAGKILNTSGVVTATGGSLGFQGGNSGANESAVVGGVISGTGGITDSQGNQNIYVVLDKANTYTGPTNLTARGGLQSNVAAAYDANGNMISSGFGVNSALVFASGLGANAGETVVLNANSQLGSLSTNGATVAVSSGNGVILNGFNLIIGGDNTSTTFNSQITGSALPNGGTTTATRTVGGNLTKIGTGTQTLGGSNLYEGVTTITGGTLAVTTLVNGGVSTTGTVSSGSNQLTVASATGVSIGQIVQSTVLAGTAETITAINGNVLTLSGNASAALTNGPVFIGTGNGLGISTNAAANLVLDGGTLQYTGVATSTDRLFTVGSAETAGATGTLDASGTGALNFTNTGAIAYGTAGQPRTVGLTGTSTAANTLAPLIGNNGSGGVVSVAKSGAGTWVLTGANTYSGGTAVNAGTLLVNGSLTPAVAGGSAVMVGATATPGASATLGGVGILTVTSATVNQNGTLAPGATVGATTGTLTLNTTGGLTINGTLAIGITGTGGTSLATTGGLTLGWHLAPDAHGNAKPFLTTRWPPRAVRSAGRLARPRRPPAIRSSTMIRLLTAAPEATSFWSPCPSPSTLWASALMLAGAGLVLPPPEPPRLIILCAGGRDKAAPVHRRGLPFAGF